MSVPSDALEMQNLNTLLRDRQLSDVGDQGHIQRFPVKCLCWRCYVWLDYDPSLRQRYVQYESVAMLLSAGGTNLSILL